MKNWVLAALCAVSGLAGAQTVQVTEPWVRATVSTSGTAAFMRLQSAGDARLLEVRSPVAGVVELHEMRMDQGIMKMRAVADLALPAGQRIDLQPGGYHVMLMDLKAPLKAGEVVPLTLVVQDAAGQRREVPVQATVRPLHMGPAAHMH